MSAIKRPILRGRDIRKYGFDWPGLWVINTHNGIKGSLERIHIEDYPSLKRHLDHYRDKLLSRADKGDTPYNLRNCAYMDDFSQPKIVWGNLNTFGSYAIVTEPFFINAPACMIVPGSDYVLAFLNSTVAEFYIRTQGVVRNGGFFEYKPMFVETIPIPTDQRWALEEIEKVLLSRCSLQERDSRIDDIVYKAYGLNEQEIAFLRSRHYRK